MNTEPSAQELLTRRQFRLQAAVAGGGLASPVNLLGQAAPVTSGDAVKTTPLLQGWTLKSIEPQGDGSAESSARWDRRPRERGGCASRPCRPWGVTFYWSMARSRSPGCRGARRSASGRACGIGYLRCSLPRGWGDHQGGGSRRGRGIHPTAPRWTGSALAAGVGY
jgi:hypothetical protein